jgi:hypothetical protein
VVLGNHTKLALYNDVVFTLLRTCIAHLVPQPHKIDGKYNTISQSCTFSNNTHYDVFISFYLCKQTISISVDKRMWKIVPKSYRLSISNIATYVAIQASPKTPL